jgi:hypothetical protein
MENFLHRGVKTMMLIFVSLLFSNYSYGQTTRYEAETYTGTDPINTNYDGGWNNPVTGVAGMSGGGGVGPSGSNPTCTGTSMRGRYVTLANLGLAAGTYHFTFGFYDDNTSSNTSTIWIMFGPQSLMAALPTPPSSVTGMNQSNTFSYTSGSVRAAFSSPSYTATMSSTDAIYLVICSGGSSSDAIWDYIDITPNNVTAPTINAQTDPSCVTENSAIGTAVYTVAASAAPDPGQSIASYSILSSSPAGGTSIFAINNSGNITVNGIVDWETSPTYVLTVRACDNGTPVLCSSNTVTLCITDVAEPPNNNFPVFTPATITAHSIAENSYYGTAVGVPIQATDADAGQTVTYSITGGNSAGKFAINPATGQITVADFLNFEAGPAFYDLQITATDNGFNGTKSTNATVRVNITDVAEPASPGITVSAGSCAGTSVPISASVTGASFAGWEIFSGGTTDITSPSSTSTTVTNHITDVTYIAKAVVSTSGSELITNGDFEAGNSVTGFSSEYTYKSGGVGSQGQFGMTQDANASSSYFDTSPDHTPTGSWYLYADGSTIVYPAVGSVVYRTTVSVAANTSYAFSAWFANGHDGAPNAAETAHLEFRVGPAGSTAFTGDVILPLDVAVWHQFTSTYINTGPATTITLEIVNRNTSATKNDFFLDDISFKQATIINQSILVPACPDPLPVELLNFEGRKVENFNALNWLTSSEKNNAYFVIERSINGTDFAAIGTVQGHGNSSETLNYHFNVEQPLNGTNYYRLKQVDFDGKFSYSNVIAINNSGEVDIDIYPNPSNGSFNIGLLAAEQPYRLTITDTGGRTVYEKSGDTVPSHIESGGLSAGVYIVHFYLNNKTLVVKKLLVY